GFDCDWSSDVCSSDLGTRKTQTEVALQRLTEQAKQSQDLELRVVRTGAETESVDGDGGTKLYQALERALSDVPRRRFAGAIFITDRKSVVEGRSVGTK